MQTKKTIQTRPSKTVDFYTNVAYADTLMSTVGYIGTESAISSDGLKKLTTVKVASAAIAAAIDALTELAAHDASLAEYCLENNIIVAAGNWTEI